MAPYPSTPACSATTTAAQGVEAPFFFCAAAAEQGQRAPAGEPQLGASAGCALVDIVDCMLAAVRVSIGVLPALQRERRGDIVACRGVAACSHVAEKQGATHLFYYLPPARDRRRQRVRQRREAAGEAAGDDLHVLSQEYSALNIDWQSTEPAALDCYPSWSTGNLG